MESAPGEDRLVSVIPVHFTNALEPNIHIHQFPLLTRPLEVPPSAAASGKCIRARLKPKVKRLEVHVPVDTRGEVWNAERSKELGNARVEDDKEKNQELPKVKQREGEEARLSEVRMRSEQVPQQGAYVLGVLREGRLHFHPISETHQFRPTLTYMDMYTRKTRRTRGGDDSDDDDGPPPDPDEPPPAPAPKKEKKPVGDAKEVQVAVRKTGESSGLQFQGGLTQVRREMLTLIHAEEDERWEDFEYCGGETAEANEAFESVFSTSFQELECKTDITSLLKDVPGFTTVSTTCRLTSWGGHRSTGSLLSLFGSPHATRDLAATAYYSYGSSQITISMTDSSDTESETSICTSGWDAADFMEMSVQLGRTGSTPAGSFDLRATFDTLRNVDICAIEHGTITYRGFGGKHPGHSVLFRGIASRSLGETSSTIAVCWVDVVLAKLGQAIVHAAAALRAQKEDDILRSAVQLPASLFRICVARCDSTGVQFSLGYNRNGQGFFNRKFYAKVSTID
ncbi:Sin-like protein conserved region-domain-containing protein [Trametes meyenii]|nr:Sin-like protein conserved region-domain-containing protein [Trametes meyenii]